MNLVYIFSNLNLIVLVIWLIFWVVLLVRFFKPGWVHNISYFKLLYIAIGLNILYGIFVTWGQYYVWSLSSEMSKFLLSAPLSKQALFPASLEWTRAIFFEGKFGYFLYYILGRIWLNIFISFCVSGILYLVFKMWKNSRGNFLAEGPEIFLILSLIVGWPKILILVPLGFIFAILSSLVLHFWGKKFVLIEIAFIFAVPLVLIFENLIFNLVSRFF